MTFTETRPLVLEELNAVLQAIDPRQVDHLCERIAIANRIAAFGMGREGLAVRGFCMRLMHLGLDAHMAGDVTAKPVDRSSAVLVSSGPGNLTQTRGMIELGQRAGAHVIVVTAQAQSPDARAADAVLNIPAQTMANDRGSTSVLSMGTAFELAMAITFDLAVVQLQGMLGQSLEQMRARHFNLE